MTVPLSQILWQHRESLPMFTVYAQPSDFPDDFVARLWMTLPEARPTTLFLRHPELEVIRSELRGLGLYQLPRDPNDDAKIVESWI